MGKAPKGRYNAIITAVEKYLPEDRLTNSDLERMVDTSDEWIRTRTGISERRILDDGRATSDMAAEAARRLLEKQKIAPEEIDLIVVATVTPDMMYPATACLVQDKIHATNAWGFDLSAGCCGFLYALVTGAQFVESGAHEKVLVIGADKMSSIVDYTDRTTCVLFGDGAGQFKPGRHLRFGKDVPMSNLYLTLLDHFGVDVESFGDSTGKLEPLSLG